MEGKGKSEIIREWIEKQLESNFDYSTAKNRSEDFKNFLKAHQADGFTEIAHKPLFYVTLRKTIEAKGLDPKTYGLKDTRKKFESSKDDMGGKITPKPKGTGKKLEEKAEDTGEEKAEDTGEEKAEDTGEEVEITTELVSQTCKFAFNILRAKYDKWRKLDQEEIEALGQAWLPLFKKYLSKNWVLWGMPLVVTFGIITTRISETKEKKNNKSSETESNSSQTSEEDSSNDKSWRDEIGIKSAKELDKSAIK